jgi:FkbM family methyltransferase
MTLRQIKRLTTKRNFQLDVFVSDTITQEIESKGEYDSNTLDSLVDILTEIRPNIALDVGANIGNHSVLIAQHVKQLIAFEPLTFIHEVLQANLKNNQLSHAQAYPLALSDKKTTNAIHILNNGNLGSSSLEFNDNVAESIEINTVVADDFLESLNIQQSIDFIKMDVEGHEVSAILGMQNIIQSHQPLMLLEWKSQDMIKRFHEYKLFNTIFKDYECLALSYTTSKKVHAKNFRGAFNRLFQKIKGKRWCFTNFNSYQSYANVYFVPKRFKSKLIEFNRRST